MARRRRPARLPPPNGRFTAALRVPAACHRARRRPGVFSPPASISTGYFRPTPAPLRPGPAGATPAPLVRGSRPAPARLLRGSCAAPGGSSRLPADLPASCETPSASCVTPVPGDRGGRSLSMAGSLRSRYLCDGGIALPVTVRCYLFSPIVIDTILYSLDM